LKTFYRIQLLQQFLVVVERLSTRTNQQSKRKRPTPLVQHLLLHSIIEMYRQHECMFYNILKITYLVCMSFQLINQQQARRHFAAISTAVPSSSSSRKAIHKNKPTKQKKKTNTTTSPTSSLTLNYRDASATRKHILQHAEDHYELSINKPSTSKNSKRAVSGKRRSLSALVKSNTRSLNSMELERRHRIIRSDTTNMNS